MYARTSSMTLTVQRERFAFSRMATRSTEPEVFTFERIPAQATVVPSYVPIRPKKRCTRVMYPAKVRMHLPPPEKSPAKRWLLVLCLVVLWQIYTEEPCAETPLGTAETPVGDYQGYAFQSAEEQALQLPHFSVSPELLPATATGCVDGGSPGDQAIPNTTCAEPGLEAESGRLFDQRAGNSYMVALLVYRLSSEN